MSNLLILKPFFYLLLLFTFLKSQPQELPSNFIVLFDLSDRIDDSYQVNRDKEIFDLIIDEFEFRQQRKYMFLTSQERIQFTWANQESQNSAIFLDLKNKLYIDMTEGRMGGRTPKPDFIKLKSDLKSNFELLYEKINPLPKTGSDIWGWFNSDLQYLLKENYNNFLIVISDGYLQFDSILADGRPKNTYMEEDDFKKIRNIDNWKEIFESNGMGLSSTSKLNQELNLILIELDPKNKLRVTNEFDIISYYWESWLLNSNINIKGFYKNDLSSSNLKVAINKFINNQ